MFLNPQQQMGLMFITTMIEEDAHTVRACIASIQQAMETLHRPAVIMPGRADPRSQAQGMLQQSSEMIQIALPSLMASCVKAHEIMGSPALSGGQEPQAPLPKNAAETLQRITDQVREWAEASGIAVPASALTALVDRLVKSRVSEEPPDRAKTKKSGLILPEG